MRRTWMIAILILAACDGGDDGGGGGDTDDTTEPGADGFVPELPDLGAYVSCSATTESDSDDDGTVEGTETETYDDLGWIVRRVYAGSFAYEETWDGRNEYGLFERHERDDEDDGTAELVEEAAYDGHLYLWNLTDDAGVVVRATHTNADGVRVATDIDEGDDGSVDVAATYSHDALWRVLRLDHDRALDGSVDAWWEYVYEGTADDTHDGSHEDEDGNVQTWRSEYDGDQLTYYAFEDEAGGFGYEATYTYEGDLVVDYALTYEDADFAYTATSAFERDAEGREIEQLLSIVFEEGGIDDIVTRYTTTWDCP